MNPRYLVTERRCAELGLTVGQLAQHYKLTSYDSALPQRWVDWCLDRGFNPVGRVVWSYDGKHVGGEPCALTREAHDELAALLDVIGQ